MIQVCFNYDGIIIIINMSVSIQLHPLVVMNVTDHLTRTKYLSKEGKGMKAVGALLGH